MLKTLNKLRIKGTYLKIIKPTASNREPNQEQTAIHNCYKENKIPRNTTNKERKGPLPGEVQTTAQRNKR